MWFYNDQLSATTMSYQAVEDTRAKVSKILNTGGRFYRWRCRVNDPSEPLCLQAPARSPDGSQPWPPKGREAIQGSPVATTASTIRSLFSVRLYEACQGAKGIES